MTLASAGLDHQEKQAQPSITPLVITPLQACRLLSVGISTVYALMRSGALESYCDGKRMRRITTQSIHDYVARRLAAGDRAGFGVTRRKQQRAQKRERA